MHERLRLPTRAGRWLGRLVLAVAVVAGLGIFIPGLVIGPSWSDSLPDVLVLVLVALAFAVGAAVEMPESLLGMVVLALGITGGDPGSAVVSMWVFTIPAWLAGIVLRSRQQLSDRLARSAVELEREREAYASEAVRYERARIARDLHDIVAHNLSMIVVQAGAGRRALDSQPEAAAASLRHIEGGAHRAELEIDQLLGMLGDQGQGSADADGLAELDELVRRATVSGLDVTYSYAGEGGRVPAAVADVIYRLGQEGLTNALKHASGAAVRVEVYATSAGVSVTITNGPPSGAGHALAQTGGGFGLEGVRRRVEELGGALTAGPTEDQGWRLAAILPV